MPTEQAVEVNDTLPCFISIFNVQAKAPMGEEVVPNIRAHTDTNRLSKHPSSFHLDVQVEAPMGEEVVPDM